MKWTVVFHDDFDPEFEELAAAVQDECYAELKFLEMFGPACGRPHVDTLKGSDYANMKELRFEAADGEWRLAFAFDPKRQAVLLVAGDKTGGSEKKFYKRLIATADERFERYLARLKNEEKQAKRPGTNKRR